MGHSLLIVARGAAPPSLEVERGGAVDHPQPSWTVARADPWETEVDHRLWLSVQEGDRLGLGGAQVEVRAGLGRVDLVQGTTGWSRVERLPEVALAGLEREGLARTSFMGTGGLVLLVALLVALGPARAGRQPEVGRWSPAALLGLALLVALVGTWPMAMAGGALVQRNFDGFGSAWLLHWMAGEAQVLPRRLDTVAFALVGGLLARVTDAVTAYHLATISGVAVSFAAATWVAGRCLGAGRLGGAVAGVAVALCPLAGTALAEGHGGWLLGPGLSLLIGALLLEPAGRPWRRAALVTGAGLLCALQSGYVAVMAAIAVGLLSLGLRRPPWRELVLALPLALAYGALVLPDARGGEGSAGSWQALVGLAAVLPPSDVATLDTLLGEPAGAGLLLGHARHPLGYALLAGGVLVPLLRRDRMGLLLAALGLVGLVLALGPRLLITCVDEGGRGPWLPYRWALAALPPLALFRFPVRFLWLWYTAAALGTGRSVAWLWRGERPAALLLAGAAVFEALWLGARPLEPRTTLATVPSAYQALRPDDVVYDLWPLHAPDHSQALELKELGCWYAADHGAGVPVPCLDVDVDQAPLYRLHRHVAAALVAGGPAPLAELRGMQVTAVAWHPDAASPELRPQVEATLRGWWGAPLAESADHGEAVLLWRLPGVAP